tara:strand:+ start:1591 stop:2184 length:594 start_codon:yes stop_codon:yes gene_type:complete
MTNKPSALTTLDHLNHYYWLKCELIAYCKNHQLPTQGSKVSLIERIKVYLTTGQCVAHKPIKNNKARDSHHHLTNETLVINYHNDTATREFFVEKLGTSFKFNQYLRQFTNPLNIITNMTYGDLVVGWRSFEDNKACSSTNHVIAPQFEYNQFIKDYFLNESSATLASAISAWKKLTTNRGPRTYKAFKALARHHTD